MNDKKTSPASETLSGILVGAATRTQETFRQPWKTPSGPPRHRAWAWAAGITVVWHGLWWFALAPAKPHSTPPAPSPVMASFLMPGQGPDGNLGDELRRFLSPVVFALPSEVGFSRTFIDQELANPPPLTTVSKQPLFLGKDEDPEEAPLPPRMRLSENVQAVLDSVALEPERKKTFKAINVGKAETPLQLRLGGDLEDLSMRAFSLPEVARLPGGKAWEVVAYIEIEPDGRVRRVVLEQSSPSVRWNMLLARTIYQFAFDESEKVRRGRLIINYAGASATNGGNGS